MADGVSTSPCHISPFVFSMLTGERRMQGIAKVLVYLAMLAFVMAVISTFVGSIITTPEAYSRAASNLALIAIALFIGFTDHCGGHAAPRSEG